MFEKLRDAKRLLIEAELLPVQGERFQPTGFADLGAATYQTADGTSMLLVESAQSVANRLEATIIGPDSELIPELEGLSYIRVQMDGGSSATTNSLVEAHRLNSPYILNSDFKCPDGREFWAIIKEDAKFDEKKPINWQHIAEVIFRYDINSLIHGVFLSSRKDLSRIKISRAISGFIDAYEVNRVDSGGVKNSTIDPKGEIQVASDNKGNKKGVYQNIPFSRIEYTAGKIILYINLDLGQLRAYDLGEDAFDLLTGLALLKVRRFLDGGLRLRTACDFKLKDGIATTEPEGFAIPEEDALLKYVQGKIGTVTKMFASPPVTEITTKVKLKAGSKNENDGE